MKNLYLIIVFLFFTNFLQGSTDSLVHKIGDQFEEFLNYNHSNDNGNFFIYYSDKFQSKPQMPVSSVWFEETVPGLTPFKTEIVDLLNEYNNKEYKYKEEDLPEWVGRLQHYVVVIDLTLAKYWKEKEIKEKLEEEDMKLNEGETTHDLAFQESVDEEFKLRLKNWKKVPSEFDVKFYISFVFVNKKLGADGFIQSDISINRARPLAVSDSYHPLFGDFIKDLHANYLKRDQLSLSVVYEEINFFINYFWERCNPLTPCSNIEANVNSTIAGEFITAYCSVITPENDPHGEKKQVLLHAAKFFDLLAYAKEYAVYEFTWNFKSNNFVDTDVKMRERWWDIESGPDKFFEFLHLYFQSPSPPKFHDYLKEYYDLNLATKELCFYEKKYLKYFININCPNSVSDLQEDIEGSLSHYKVVPVTAYLNGIDGIIGGLADLIEGVGNYFVNSSFDDQLDCANDLTDQDKAIIVNYFLNDAARKADLEQILWTEILSPYQNEIPALGPSSIEMAGKLSNLIVSVVGGNIPYRGDDDPNDNENTNTVIVTNVNKTLFPDKAEIDAPILGIGGKVITQTVYESSVTRDNSNLTFTEAYCPSIKFETLNFIGFWVNDDCTFYEEESSEIGTYDFFDVVYSVKVNDPGFFKDGCQDAYGNTCKNTINLECAFVTATRIRQEKFDHVVNDATNIVSVVTLPYSVSALGAARGLQLIKHGIFVTSDVVSIAIALNDQEELNQKFKNTFGESAGQNLYTGLIQLTALISTAELADFLITKSSGINSYKSIPDFTDDELAERVALAKYSQVDNYVNTPNHDGEVLMRKSMVGTLLTLESTMIARKEEVFTNLIREKLRGLYPSLKSIDVLSEEGEKLRELIHLYRGKQAKFAEAIELSDRIDALIDGMSAAKINRLKLALNEYPGLKAILTEFDDPALNARRMRSWEIIDGQNKTLKADFASIKKLSEDFGNNPDLEEWMQLNASEYAPYVSQTKYELWDEIVAPSITSANVKYRSSINFLESYTVTKNAPKIGDNTPGAFETHLFYGDPKYSTFMAGTPDEIIYKSELKGLHHTEGVSEIEPLVFTGGQVPVTFPDGTTGYNVYTGPPPTNPANTKGHQIAIESGSQEYYPNQSIKKARTYIWGKYDDGLGNLVDAWRIKKAGAVNNHKNSYFPNWTKQETIEEIAYARSRLTMSDKVAGNNNEWKILSSDGSIDIHMYIGPNNPTSVPTLSDLFGSAFAK